MRFSIWVRKKFRDHGAEILAVFPVAYIAVTWLLSVATRVTKTYFGWQGLGWQMLGSVYMAMFVLGPLCIVASGVASISHAVNKLRAGKPARKYIILMIVDLAVIALAALWFYNYWYA